MSSRRDAMNEMALAYILRNAYLLNALRFETMVSAVQLIDDLVADMHVRAHKKGRDLVDISSALVDRIGEWRAEHEDLAPDPDLEADIEITVSAPKRRGKKKKAGADAPELPFIMVKARKP